MSRHIGLVGAKHSPLYEATAKKGHVDPDHPFLKNLESAFARAVVHLDPDTEFLRAYVESNCQVLRTAMGSLSFPTAVKARAETHCRTPEEIEEEMSYVLNRIPREEWVVVRASMFEDPALQSNCAVFVPSRIARVAKMWAKSLYPPIQGVGIDSAVIFFDRWDRLEIIDVPKIGVRLTLGADYTGFAKKGNLGMQMHFVEKSGMGVSIHGSSLIMEVFNQVRQQRIMAKRGFVIVAPTGTGKSTLLYSGADLLPPERAWHVQDDFVALIRKYHNSDQGVAAPYLKAVGTEAGYYMIVWHMNENSPMWDAFQKKTALFENVPLGPDGVMNFNDEETFGTTNQRGIVPRDAIPKCSPAIDLDHVDFVVLVVRDPFAPPVALTMTPEQSLAEYLTIQSITTPAQTTDRTQWYKSKFEAGAHPFLLPLTNERIAEHAMALYEMIKGTHVQFVVMNTGGIGFGDQDGYAVSYGPSLSKLIMRNLARGNIKWAPSPLRNGMLVPVDIPGIEDLPESETIVLDPAAVMDKKQFRNKWAEAVEAKKAYFNRFADYLSPEIVKTFRRSFKTEK